MERKLLMLNAVLLAVLVVVMLVDLTRRNEPLQQLRLSVEQLDRTVQQLSSQQRGLRNEVGEAVDAIRSGRLVGHHAGTGDTVMADRDGLVKEGVDFLLPPPNDLFDPERAGGELRYYEVEPVSFNDILSSLVVTSDANALVNDSLCYWDYREPYVWIEGLATAVVIEDDYRTFTFDIRRGVYWQVPRIARKPGYQWLDREVELTAHDFKFYIDLVTNPDVETHLRNYYEGCSAEVVDDYTLVVRWEESQYTNIDFTLGLTPFPRHIYRYQEDGTEIPELEFEAYFNEHWFDREKQLIGVGRYRLESVEPGVQTVFARNKGYYGEPWHFDRIVWNAQVQDSTAQLVGFKNNDVHRHGLAPNQYKAQILDRNEERFAAYDPEDPHSGREGAFGWEQVKSSSFSSFAWNMRRPTLSDHRVRQALAHALDRVRLEREIFFGLGEPKIGPVHPDSLYYNDDLEQYDYDLDRARALLDEAGWRDSNQDAWRDQVIDGELVTLSLDFVYYAQSDTFANLLSVYRDDLQKIGVELNLVPVEAKEWERRANDRDFDAFGVAWRSGLEVDFKQLWHSEGADDPNSSNFPGFSDPEADRIAEALRVTFDMERRIELAYQMQAIIHEAQPYLFINAREGVRIWHNEPNAPGDNRELLGGMAWTLDNYHPLMNGRVGAFGPLHIEQTEP